MQSKYYKHISSTKNKHEEILVYTLKYFKLDQNLTLKSAYEGLRWTTKELSVDPSNVELTKLQTEYFKDLWKISKKLSPNLFYLR